MDGGGGQEEVPPRLLKVPQLPANGRGEGRQGSNAREPRETASVARRNRRPAAVVYKGIKVSRALDVKLAARLLQLQLISRVS